MTQRTWIVAGLAALALLAACGGSGDDSTDPSLVVGAVTDKYDGTWTRCVSAGSGSRRDNVNLVKFDSATLVFASLTYTSPSPDCTEVGASTWTSGNVVFHGSKSIAGATVDKVIVNTDGGGSQKQVYLIQGAGTGPFTLTTGRVDAGVDADGYPGTLDSNSFLKGGARLAKYLGTWSSGCIASDGGSRKEILTLTKISDSSAELTWERPAYSSRNCSGTAVSLVDQAGFLLQGTKTIGTDTVDKVILSFDAPRPAQQMVFLVKDSKPATLTYGRTDAGTDPDGYPTTLNGSVLTMQ